jgi:hypothetical protein
MEEPDRSQIPIRYDTCALCARYLRLQMPTQNVSYLLVFHGNIFFFIFSQCTRLYVHFLSSMLLISAHVGVVPYDFLRCL